MVVVLVFKIRIAVITVNMILTLKSIGKNFYEKIPTKTCHIMDALHRSTHVDFRLTCFSILRFFCDLLRIFKVSINMILPLKSIGKNLYEKNSY
jgi:hypothetical protein